METIEKAISWNQRNKIKYLMKSTRTPTVISDGSLSLSLLCNGMFLITEATKRNPFEINWSFDTKPWMYQTYNQKWILIYWNHN